ncbi:MAG: GPW/gp25 family protein [Tannerellaceae bacterium]|nr:GPW/gp25 family protein [Tannerellaceae bacterium]
MGTNKSFIGTGWAFPPRFIQGIGVEMVSQEEDIEQSLTILLSTIPGERLYRFKYGCNIRRWVFEEMNLSNETLMIESIEEAILYNEPRIDVEQIRFDTKDEAEGILWITIHYRIRETNTRSNMVYPYYFKEGTNL